MSVVSNAGPLIALARVGRLGLLSELYGQIVIPGAVRDEVMSDATLAGAVELASASWLRVIEVQERPAVEMLQLTLDKGESEAIILARLLDAVLLIDERRGRAIAAGLGMRHTGTIGVLLAAKRSGSVSSVRPILDQLDTVGIRISSTLRLEALRLADELAR